MRDGDFTKLVRRLESEKDSRGNGIAIDAIAITVSGSEFRHCFTSQGRSIHTVRSISKLIVALCFGIAIASKRFAVGTRALGLDTRIWPVFWGKIRIESSQDIKRLQKVTVKHLLTQTTGYANSELMFTSWMQGKNPHQFLEALLNEPLAYEPGTCFVYSNASSFILSALFQELSGESLYSAAQRELFEPLGVVEHRWLDYAGYTAGSTGLYLLPEDLHKLGLLMLQKGAWHGRQIVPTWFVEMMGCRSVHVRGERQFAHPLLPSGYGFLIWITDSGFYASGAMGQYLIVEPSRQTVVSISARQEEPNQMLKCILSALADARG